MRPFTRPRRKRRRERHIPAPSRRDTAMTSPSNRLLLRRVGDDDSTDGLFPGGQPTDHDPGVQRDGTSNAPSRYFLPTGQSVTKAAAKADHAICPLHRFIGPKRLEVRKPIGCACLVTHEPPGRRRRSTARLSDPSGRGAPGKLRNLLIPISASPSPADVHASVSPRGISGSIALHVRAARGCGGPLQLHGLPQLPSLPPICEESRSHGAPDQQGEDRERQQGHARLLASRRRRAGPALAEVYTSSRGG